jgi:hypothetical protein
MLRGTVGVNAVCEISRYILQNIDENAVEKVIFGKFKLDVINFGIEDINLDAESSVEGVELGLKGVELGLKGVELGLKGVNC